MDSLSVLQMGGGSREEQELVCVLGARDSSLNRPAVWGVPCVRGYF